jgi:hypothetical protein
LATKSLDVLDIRVLKQAMELMGSKRALARHLKIAEIDLQAFLTGTAKPPRPVFLGAVDALITFGHWSSFDNISVESSAAPAPLSASEPVGPKL